MTGPEGALLGQRRARSLGDLLDQQGRTSLDGVDLTDAAVRRAVSDRLMQRYTGRAVIFGPGILAARTDFVGWVDEVGGSALVLSTAAGAGPKPPAGSCRVVPVTPPATTSVTEELRTLDRLARHLPPDVVAAIEEFDPERHGCWVGGPFVTTDEPILGRPVLSGRPAAFVALEDKLLADRIWQAAGVAHAAYAIVPVDLEALGRASRDLAGELGVVWSGDTKEGFNGGGDFVRWVRDPDDPAEVARAHAFFAPRCDRVRVLPFLDGVPCSIHGLVLPDGTAALRPVEISILRDEAARTFRYGGLSTYWDAPPPDREQMRGAARRVGEHLRSAIGYRGAFGIDGVLTAEGFRPTELNTRASAGFTVVTGIDRQLFTLLQDALVLGEDPGIQAGEVEALVPLMDAAPAGRPVALAADTTLDPGLGGEAAFALAWDGGRLEVAGPATSTTDDVLAVADTPSGIFAKIDPCGALAPGARLAHLNAALYDLLDRRFGTRFGTLVPAPDLR